MVVVAGSYGCGGGGGGVGGRGGGSNLRCSDAVVCAWSGIHVGC